MKLFWFQKDSNFLPFCVYLRLVLFYRHRIPLLYPSFIFSSNSFPLLSLHDFLHTDSSKFSPMKQQRTRLLHFLDAKIHTESCMSISPLVNFIMYLFHHLEFASCVIEVHTLSHITTFFLIGLLRSHIQYLPKSIFLPKCFLFKFFKIHFSSLAFHDIWPSWH